MATTAAVATAAFILALQGCAQPSRFEKAGISEEMRKTDVRECRKSVRKAYPPPNPALGTPSYGIEAGIAQGLVDADRIGGYRRRLYEECMTKRGYKKVKTS